MRILLHDYSGHPFQAQLSRELARRGHDMDHVFCASYVSGKGQLERRADDPPNLGFTPLQLSRPFDKYTMRRRARQEMSYARTFMSHAAATRPDLIVMCNVPLLAHAVIDRKLHRLGIPVVFWQQDVYSEAMGYEAHRRFGPLGPIVARTFGRLERQVAHRSEAVIAISDRFRAVHDRWGTPAEHLHVIANWGPVEEIVPRRRDNAWAREHGLSDEPVMLYSGTLGLKHDPRQLVDLLRRVRERISTARLVVVSEGIAARELAEIDEPGLTVLPFQPFEVLSDVLATGDVLVTILEPQASEYSVPSKTLSYLCAGRPVVALMPESNPAYRIITETGGIGIDLLTTGIEVGAEQVADLLADAVARTRIGRQARAYAERNFDIRTLAGQFERVFLDSVVEPAHTEAFRGGPVGSERELAQAQVEGRT
jgi:glycosyltransferase involved in cell wall biosynthesis